MKKIKTILVLCLISIGACMFSACSLFGATSGEPTQPYIINMVETGDDINGIQYTIFYSDGSEESIFIPKKITQEVGITIDDLKEYYGEDFDTWLNQNITIDYSGTTSVSISDLKEYVETELKQDFDDYISQHLQVTYTDPNYVDFNEIVDYCEKNGKDISDYITVTVSNDKYAVNQALKSSLLIVSKESEVSSPSMGSGFIYKTSGQYSYIVTCEHVVRDGTIIYAYQYGSDDAYESDCNNGFDSFTDGKALKCEYVGGSFAYDVAVLRVPTNKLTANNASAEPVKIANKYSLAETVYAVGNARGWSTSATKGIVSVVSEYCSVEGRVIREIRIDAAVNGGNSGGGLFNANGEIVGMVNAKVENEKIDNMAMAIPFDNFTKVADNLIYTYESKIGIDTIYAWSLGDITIASTSTKVVYDTKTQEYIQQDSPVVYSISNDAYGYTLGLRQKDVIKKCIIGEGSYAVEVIFTRHFQFEEFLLTLRSGDKVTFVVERGGVETSLNMATVDISHFAQIL